MLFFAIVYTVEGFCQAKVGIVWQPLTHYLKETQGWDAVQIAASLAVLDVPWVVKPLYGMLSDFLPLFGYRRRSYLLAANLVAVAAFLWTTQLLAPGAIVLALLFTSIGMAVASTVCGALLVENGQRHGASAAFVNQQWLWFYVAVMIATVTGGVLIDRLSPAGALHVALAIAAAAPLAVLAAIPLLEERRAGIGGNEFRRAWQGFVGVFRSRTLWVIGAFLFCYYFSPGFGTPLYFYLTDHLHFSQSTIGVLSSVSAAGWIAGGLVYRFLLRGLTTRALLNLSIVAGALSTLAYLGMVDLASAAAVYFLSGVANMIANLATLTLAADHCPPRSEGFAFAALMSVINLATPLADTIGAYLYEHMFHQSLAPLLVASAAFTALILVLVPLLERR
ncbi:MAG: MFS transporter [Acetobacteraceae bacterium]